jgi:hypothetical protein
MVVGPQLFHIWAACCTPSRLIACATGVRGKGVGEGVGVMVGVAVAGGVAEGRTLVGGGVVVDGGVLMTGGAAVGANVAMAASRRWRSAREAGGGVGMASSGRSRRK